MANACLVDANSVKKARDLRLSSLALRPIEDHQFLDVRQTMHHAWHRDSCMS